MCCLLVQAPTKRVRKLKQINKATNAASNRETNTRIDKVWYNNKVFVRLRRSSVQRSTGRFKRLTGRPFCFACVAGFVVYLFAVASMGWFPHRRIASGGLNGKLSILIYNQACHFCSSPGIGVLGSRISVLHESVVHDKVQVPEFAQASSSGIGFWMSRRDGFGELACWLA